MINITPFGILFILVICLLYQKRDILIYLFIVTIPFTSTAVIELNLGDSPFVLSPSLLVGMLILMNSIRNIRYIKINAISLALLFIPLVSLCSLLWNYINPIEIMSFDSYTQRNYSTSSTPNISSFTQFLYLMFWSYVSIVISEKFKTTDKNSILKVINYTTIFVVVWGIAYISLNRLNINFPIKFFNNSSSPFLQGYLQNIDGANIRRMTSVSSEPSILSMFLAPVIFMNISLIISKYDKISIMNYIVVVMGFLGLLLTFSTTAYIGIASGILLSILIIYKNIAYINQKASIFVIAMSTIIILILLITSSYYGDYIINATLNKSSTASYNARSGTVDAALSAFNSSWIFGAGVGKIIAFSMIVWIIGAMGIIGSIPFISIFVLTIRKYILSNGFAVAAAGALIVYFVQASVSGFSFTYAQSWYLIPLLSSFVSPIYYRSRLIA